MRSLASYRSRFPILKTKRYLASHSMGAMPRATLKSLRRYGEEWASLGVEAYDRWIPRFQETADLVAGIIGAPPGTVVFHQNASTLLAIVLSAILKPGGRREIVTTDLNFPSLYYNLLAHREAGLAVKVVKSPDGITIPTEEMVAAVTGRTLAVMIDHGIFRSGFLQDLGAIHRAARKQGALTIVDGYQTVGVVPIDVKALGIDFLIGGSHKWLCGGPGAAFLYTKSNLLRKLHPRVTGWFAQARPFDFSMKPREASSAMRFATGTPSMAAIAAACEGIALVAKVGVDRIRDHNVKLMESLISEADAAGLTVKSPRDPAKRSGLVCIDFKRAKQAEPWLLDQGFQLDHRPGSGLRLSAHFYTDEDELLSIIPAIKGFQRGG